MNFEDFWILVADRGRVAHYYKDECATLWKKYTPQQQQAIYDAIEKKIRAGKFVSFRPNEAIRDNVPKAPEIQVLSFEDYYKRYQTTLETDGWHMENPTGQKVIYVKQ